MTVFSKNKHKNLKILYAAGPGNIIETYQYWRSNEDDQGQTSLTYSGQFYTVCRDLNAEAYVISSYQEKQIIKDNLLILEHRPIPFSHSSGILYHLGLLWYGLGLIFSAIRFQANVAVISDGTVQWFLLSLFPLFGIKVVPSLHCVLYLKYSPLTPKQKFLLRLSRHLFTKDCSAVIAVSDEIGEQIKQLTNEQNKPILRSFPIYRREQFDNIGELALNSVPFRVLYIGRIEANKGVFTLLEVAKELAAQNRTDVRFDLCGDGSALTELQEASTRANINSFFVCHGHCNKSKIKEMLGQCHIIIVPTRSDFAEGFNKVVVEGVLAHRPVIASKVCNDLSLLQEAVIAVEPDHPQGYTQAILQLMSDHQLYQAKQKASQVLQEQFYDLSQGWGSQLTSILLAIQEGREIESKSGSSISSPKLCDLTTSRNMT